MTQILKHSVQLGDHACRHLIDVETIFLAWRQETLRKPVDLPRVTSLYRELQLMRRLSWAHKAGQAPASLVNFLDEMPDQGQYYFISPYVLHTYAIMAGVRWKSWKKLLGDYPWQLDILPVEPGFATGLVISARGSMAWSAAPAPEDFVREAFQFSPARESAVAVQELLDAQLLLPRYPEQKGRQFNLLTQASRVRAP